MEITFKDIKFVQFIKNTDKTESSGCILHANNKLIRLDIYDTVTLLTNTDKEFTLVEMKDAQDSGMHRIKNTVKLGVFFNELKAYPYIGITQVEMGNFVGILITKEPNAELKPGETLTPVVFHITTDYFPDTTERLVWLLEKHNHMDKFPAFDEKVNAAESDKFIQGAFDRLVDAVRKQCGHLTFDNNGYSEIVRNVDLVFPYIKINEG